MSGGAIQALAMQILEFSGSEDENVTVWIQRVDKVAEIHNTSDGVLLLAATSRLTKSARRWYDSQSGAVIESWRSVRSEIVKIFDRKIPFFKMMQKIEARKWLSSKESFDEYAIDKLALMHRVGISEADKIQLLISGVAQNTIRAVASSVSEETVDAFLSQMRKITQGVIEQDKKVPLASSAAKPRDGQSGQCRNCGKKGHDFRECKGQVNCFYCKQIGHRSYDCPQLKQKRDGTPAARPLAATTVAEASAADDHQEPEMVAAVREERSRLVVSKPSVKICNIGGCKPCISSEMTYCKNGSVINDRCYCDSGYNSDSTNIFYMSQARCVQVAAAYCMKCC
ncbi:hypothetical protein DMN91_003703 [Ooceraea biroi]|uniref:CCHC-type domain-containing protein n=1 Tax=Ooceraea biroi TaxID=2015173 RepID=A0A3L8DUS8_OOCBI|nr:hypothetical protein DMN91_003703 [Ooceraea biroi]